MRAHKPWHDTATRMRAEGASYRQMVEACGVCKNVLVRFFNPAYHARQNARVAAYQKRLRATSPEYRARRVAQSKLWNLRRDAKCEAYDTGRRYEDVCADWDITP